MCVNMCKLKSGNFESKHFGSIDEIHIWRWPLLLSLLFTLLSYLFSEHSSLKALRPHIGRTSFHVPMKSTPGLVPHPPPVQPVHGRTDWSAKYSAHRWCLAHEQWPSPTNPSLLWPRLFKEFIFHCMYLNAILYHFGIVFIMMGAVNIFIGPVHICISGLGGAFLYDELWN